MITSAQTFAAYSEAWASGDFARLTDLLERVAAAISAGDTDPAHRINYGALLLDLGRDVEARDWLVAHPLEYREYYENLAIARFKTARRAIGAIRESNRRAQTLSKCSNAIVAYVDYQAS